MSDRVRLPDPTGINPRYYIANDTRYIYRGGMVVTFPNGGVFLNSLRIFPTSAPTDETQEWKRAADWIVDCTCYDDEAGSDARMANPDFSSDLVKQIIITTGRTLPEQVVLSYQSYYDVSDFAIPGDGTPVEFTPEGWKSILQANSKLMQQIAAIQSTTAPTEAALTLYPEDLNGQTPGNVVPPETYQVNTTTGVNLIRAKNGPFFRDSVALTANGTPLVEGVDYQCDTLDRNRTRKSRNVSGIYWAILIISPQAGPIQFGYRTTGGRVTQENYLALAAQVKDTIAFINGMDILTESGLSLSPTMQSVLWRLDNQDKQMRSLLATPNYSAATAGVSVQKVFTATDSKLHWYDIASLYKAVATGPVVTADRFKGRVFLPGSNVAWTFTVEANLNQPKQPITFSTQSILVDPGVTLDGTVDAKTPVWPILRAVWNDLTSGITLQLGLANPNLTENPIIEDMSTAESVWVLDQTNPVIAGNAAPASVVIHDSGFTLPDGVSKWIGDATSQSVVYVPPVKDGYPLFAGKTDLIRNFANNTLTGVGTYDLSAHPLVNFNYAVLVVGTEANALAKVHIPLQEQYGNSTPTLVGYGVIPVSNGVSANVAVTVAQTDAGVSYTVQLLGTALATTDDTSIRGIRITP